MNMNAIVTIIDKSQQTDIFELDIDKTIKLEMKASTLKQLLETRQVCASDFRCLDCSSRLRMKRLCLETCLKCLS